MRYIPPLLKAHLQGNVTTTCRILKFTLQNGTVIGLSGLDKNIVYKGVTYWAIDGFDSKTMSGTTGAHGNNSEVNALISDRAEGIDETFILAGGLDNAAWELMLVNWNDLLMGHMTIDAGDVGIVKVVDGIVYVPELISYGMRLRQVIGGVWSRRCRAVFGSPAESQTGCGVDVESMWHSGVVTGLSSDNYRVFADSNLIGNGYQLVPGRIQWLTGNNASSRLYQVEAYSDLSGTVALMEPTNFQIQNGDTFRFRDDCDKSLTKCKYYNNVVNMKAEPYIPVEDGLESMTPNAQTFGGVSGSTIED